MRYEVRFFMAQVKKEIIENICDVCGEEADGHWNSIEYLNDRIFAEYSCPVDLCQKHMTDFALYFSNQYKEERYESYDEKKKEELIEKLKQKGRE